MKAAAVATICVVAFASQAAADAPAPGAYCTRYAHERAYEVADRAARGVSSERVSASLALADCREHTSQKLAASPDTAADVARAVVKLCEIPFADYERAFGLDADRATRQVRRDRRDLEEQALAIVVSWRANRCPTPD